MRTFLKPIVLSIKIKFVLVLLNHFFNINDIIRGNFMKRIFSYIFPFRLNNYTSKINGLLEINLINGRKTLDTHRSNYSYGSLQKILHKGVIL